MKKDPTLRVSGSASSITIPLRRRIASTAARTSATVGASIRALAEIRQHVGIGRRRRRPGAAGTTTPVTTKRPASAPLNRLMRYANPHSAAGNLDASPLRSIERRHRLDRLRRPPGRTRRRSESACRRPGREYPTGTRGRRVRAPPPPPPRRPTARPRPPPSRVTVVASSATSSRADAHRAATSPSKPSSAITRLLPPPSTTRSHASRARTRPARLGDVARRRRRGEPPRADRRRRACVRGASGTSAGRRSAHGASASIPSCARARAGPRRASTARTRSSRRARAARPPADRRVITVATCG